MKTIDQSEGSKAVNVGLRGAAIASTLRLPRNLTNADETLPDAPIRKVAPEYFGWGSDAITGSGDGRTLSTR